MTEERPGGDEAPSDEPTGTDFRWDSPRWREADPQQTDAERGRRFRDDRAPRQRGAIDAGGSVTPPREDPEDGTDATEP